MKTPLITKLTARGIPRSETTLSRSYSRRSRLLGLLGLGIPLLAYAARAQTWQTVDDFQYAVGTNSYATGLAKDALGNIYAVGDAEDLTGTWHALAMKSSDSGASWFLVDDHTVPAVNGAPSGYGHEREPSARTYVDDDQYEYYF